MKTLVGLALGVVVGLAVAVGLSTSIGCSCPPGSTPVAVSAGDYYFVFDADASNERSDEINVKPPRIEQTTKSGGSTWIVTYKITGVR